MSKSLLVVTPQTSFGAMLRSSLEESGQFHVYIAGDEPTALIQLKSEDCELAFLDVDLGMDAVLEIGRALRTVRADVGLVIMSDEDLPPALDSLRPWTLLRKPFYLPELMEMAQLIHISGDLDWPEVQAKATEIHHPHYHAYPYLHEEMGAAFAASDVVLSRAGASTLGEYPLFGLPAVLVPYPYAWRYQKVNADYLVQRNAAVLIEDSQLEENLIPVIKNLLSESTRLASMRHAVKALAQPQAAKSISNLLFEMAQRGAR